MFDHRGQRTWCASAGDFSLVCILVCRRLVLVAPSRPKAMDFHPSVRTALQRAWSTMTGHLRWVMLCFCQAAWQGLWCPVSSIWLVARGSWKEVKAHKNDVSRCPKSSTGGSRKCTCLLPSVKGYVLSQMEADLCVRVDDPLLPLCTAVEHLPSLLWPSKFSGVQCNWWTSVSCCERVRRAHCLALHSLLEYGDSGQRTVARICGCISGQCASYHV